MMRKYTTVTGRDVEIPETHDDWGLADREGYPSVTDLVAALNKAARLAAGHIMYRDTAALRLESLLSRRPDLLDGNPEPFRVMVRLLQQIFPHH